MRNVFCIMLLLFSINGMCKIYTWTDGKGAVHYSDLPQHQDAQEIKINVTPASSSPQTYEAQYSLSLEDDDLASNQQEKISHDKCVQLANHIVDLHAKPLELANPELSQQLRAGLIFNNFYQA